MQRLPPCATVRLILNFHDPNYPIPRHGISVHHGLAGACVAAVGNSNTSNLQAGIKQNTHSVAATRLDREFLGVIDLLLVGTTDGEPWQALRGC